MSDRTSHEQIADIITRAGLTFHALPAHPKETGPAHKVGCSWSVEITNASSARYVTSYSAGILAALGKVRTVTPDERGAMQKLRGYGARLTTYDAEAIERLAKRAKPDPVDVLACLVRDADSVNGVSLGEFARELCDGMDALEALDVYRACERTAAALRELIPMELRAELADAVQEY